MGDRIDADEERNAEGHNDPRRQSAPSSKDYECKGMNKVELLLNGKRPRVQERLQLGGWAEVAGALIEVEVRGENRRRRGALGEGDEVGRDEQRKGRNGRGCHHHKQRRQDASRPPFVELQQREPTRLHLGKYDGRDQITGDDEEHIDAGVTAAQKRHSKVVENHQPDGDGTKPVDVGPVWDSVRVRRPNELSRQAFGHLLHAPSVPEAR